MSVNCVMLQPRSQPPYIPLPHEQTLFTSSPRIQFNLSTPSHYPGKQQQPFSLSASSGVLYLTNRRLVFIPDKSTAALQSFAAPILSLHDSHVATPWFGPNVWTALLQPTGGGGIPMPASGVVEVKMTFKEGGAFDFHSAYERTRERIQQAMETMRSGDAATAADGVNAMSVNLDQLPAYQEQSDGPLIAPLATTAVQLPPPPTQPHPGSPAQGAGDQRQSQSGPESEANIPVEPPPDYEEALRAGL